MSNLKVVRSELGLQIIDGLIGGFFLRRCFLSQGLKLPLKVLNLLFIIRLGGLGNGKFSIGVAQLDHGITQGFPHLLLHWIHFACLCPKRLNSKYHCYQDNE